MALGVAMTFRYNTTGTIQERKIDKLEFIKTKTSVKNSVKKIRIYTTDWEKIFAKETHLIKDCYPKYTKRS